MKKVEPMGARDIPPDDDTQDVIDKQWPGFTVTCNACGSSAVELENDQGFSEMSGSWGGLHFHCTDCGSRVTIAGD